MDAALARKIERNVERLASALFGGAVAYAAYAWFATFVPQPRLGAFTGGVFAVAYLMCSRTLHALHGERRGYPVPMFDVRAIEPELLPVLELTEADRLPEPEPLVLDDILAEIGPDSRVVRLFDRSAMPTPGQLKARIDQHLEQGPPAPGSDASQALSDALAELRRALR
jgi:hypothetical protein